MCRLVRVANAFCEGGLVPSRKRRGMPLTKDGLRPSHEGGLVPSRKGAAYAAQCRRRNAAKRGRHDAAPCRRRDAAKRRRLDAAQCRRRDAVKRGAA